MDGTPERKLSIGTMPKLEKAMKRVKSWEEAQELLRKGITVMYSGMVMKPSAIGIRS